jgi:hypothetical protein
MMILMCTSDCRIVASEALSKQGSGASYGEALARTLLISCFSADSHDFPLRGVRRRGMCPSFILTATDKQRPRRFDATTNQHGFSIV